MFSLNVFAYIVRFLPLHYASHAGYDIIMKSFCTALVIMLRFISFKGAFVQDVLAAHYDFKRPLSLPLSLCLCCYLCAVLA